MRGYNRDEVEEYEEYDDYEDEEAGQEEEVEEYKEAKEQKPTVEELEYLELRARIKEQIRKKMQRESGSAASRVQIKKNKVSSDNFGSFFGPSQPVIAQRVIHESKSLLENPHLAFRSSNTQSNNKKGTSSGAAAIKNGVRPQLPKVRNEVQVKAKKLKDARDYSFLLSNDAELPLPKKQPPPRNVSFPKSEVQPTQMSQKSRQQSGDSGRIVDRQDRKGVSMNGQLNSKSAQPSVSKQHSSSMDSRKQLGSNSGIGPGRPSTSNGSGWPSTSNGSGRPSTSNGSGRPSTSYGSSRPSSSNGSGRPVAPNGRGRPAVPNGSGRPAVPNGPGRPAPENGPVRSVAPNGSSLKRPVTLEKKAPPSGVKNVLPASHKPLPSKMQSVAKQQIEQRRVLQEPSKARPLQKQQAPPSKSQTHKPSKPIQLQSSSYDNRPQKRPARPFSDDEDDDTKALSMIRRMFNTQRFAGRDDDDSDMEANFDDIMREERRSAKIARKEDEEQLRLIEEEERRERMRKVAKKQKT